MRVTLLGTGSADGWPNPFCRCASCAAERAAGRARRPSSALIDDVLLVDVGPTAPHLPAGTADLADVEHVLLTHGHPDHLHPAFLLTRHWVSPTRDLHVWGPPAAIDLCRDWIAPDGRVHLHATAPGEHLTLATGRGEYTVDVHPSRHAHGDGDLLAEEALLFTVSGPDGGRLLYATDTGPFHPADLGIDSRPVDLVLIDETFGDTLDHGTGHLDLDTLPGVLDALRQAGVVTASTRVIATHLSHHNPPSPELRARLEPLGVTPGYDGEVHDTGATTSTGHRHLVLGGARSGKSRFAEGLLGTAPEVTYVATGGERADDPEWVDRVRLHQERRPDHWHTVETVELAPLLASARRGAAVLIDCLALWLTAVLDARDAWERLESGGRSSVVADVECAVDELVSALGSCHADVVLVSNEVGMGVVPATASGRLFQDLLGTVNARVGAVVDDVTLVVAGRPLTMDGAAALRSPVDGRGGLS